MYITETLSNGLRIITHEMKGRNSVAVGLWVGVGGRYEPLPQKGAAHLLEHMVFKGSRHYSCEEIKSSIEGIGGTLNAFTSEEQTCYYAKIPAQYFKSTFDVLSDMVFSPLLQTPDLKKEKTVIIEEIKMYHDLPQYYVLEIMEGLVWPHHSLGKSLAGTEETVSNMHRPHLIKFHDTFYKTNNVVISVCGKVSHREVVRLAKKKCGLLKRGSPSHFEPFLQKQTKPSFKSERRSIEQMHLALGLTGYDEYHPDRYGLSLISIILGGNMSSRLFTEIREKRGWAYSVSSSYKMLHDTGLFLIRAGVDNRKIGETVDLVLAELEKMSTKEVAPKELQRAKDYLVGQFLLGLEDTMDHMLWIGEEMISKNRVANLKTIIQKVKSLTASDLKRIARDILRLERYNLAVIGPLTDTLESQLKKSLAIN